MQARHARQKSGLTQAAFAERTVKSVANLRDWEQGRLAPLGVVLCLPHLMIKHPELSLELIAECCVIGVVEISQTVSAVFIDQNLPNVNKQVG
jgi:hypothetical protein